MDNDAESSASDVGTKVRVLSLPGRNYPHNPYFGLFCDGLAQAGAQIISVHSPDAKMFGFDIMHLHFPEHYIQEKALWKGIVIGTLFLIYAATARLLGKKIVWTIHEAIPTKRYGWLVGLYLRCVRKLVHGYVFMNNTTQNAFLEKYPSASRKRLCRIRHCPYEVNRLSQQRRDEIRGTLIENKNCFLVGYLGEIRDYKQPGLLSTLPPQHTDGCPVKIVAAGALNAAADAKNAADAFSALGRDRLIRIDRRLSDKELSELIQAVDVVFLPYAYGWNSGFAMLTLSCGTPLIASDIPMFKEIYDELGAPWVQLYRTREDFAELDVASAVSRVTNDYKSEVNQKLLVDYLELCGHSQSAKTLLKFYTTL